MWAGPSDSSLKIKIWPKWWHVTTKTRLQEDCSFHFGAPFTLLPLREASCHTVSCPKVRSMWQGTHVSWWTASHCLPTAMPVSLEADPPQVEPWENCNQHCQHHQLQPTVSKPNKLSKYMVLSSTVRSFTNKLTKDKLTAKQKEIRKKIGLSICWFIFS